MSATVIAEEPRTAMAEVGHLRLERLEYGKVCVQPDGRIEDGAEHGELGRSSGFPGEVAAWCDPSFLGVVTESFESLPADCPHGTVLRPIVVEERAVPVLCRVRNRPEDGENGRSRRYTQARYIVSPDEVSPLVLFAGMESQRLRGLTRVELAQGLPPLHVASPATPRWEDSTQSFLRQAVVFALSGVPMAVGEKVEEKRFFEWVAGLWWLLPPPLRPLLSAGWGVGRSLSGVLAVSYAAEIAETAAVFSPATRSWTPPSRVFLEKQGRWETAAFQDLRLVPGRMYAFSAFGAGGVPESLSLRPEVVAWSRGIPAFTLPEQPDFRNPVTVRAFRWPGLRALDAFRAGQLRRWLETGLCDETNPVEVLATGFIYPESELQALAAAVTALAEPGHRSRAELFLFRFLARELPPAVRDGLLAASRPGASRARLIASLVGVPGLPVLESLREALAAGEAGELSGDIAVRLRAALEARGRTLDAASTDLHARLLLTEGGLEIYRAWVGENLLPLAFALARWRPPDMERALAVLPGLGRSPGLAAVIHWLLGQLPDEQDLEGIAALPPAYRALLAVGLGEDWVRPGRDIVERRERVLAWARAQRPEPSSEPLLRFALGADDLDAGEVQWIADAVEEGTVPASLVHRLSTLALREWAALGARLRQRGDAWDAAVSLWPWQAARLLLDRAAPAGDDRARAAEELESLARDLQLADDEVQTLIERWLPRLASGDPETRSLLGYLWRWTVRSRQSSLSGAGIPEVCRELEQGKLSQSGRLSDEEIAKVVWLAQESGAAAELLERAGGLWRAATAFWQIRLLFELFPDVDLEPSVQQLEMLARRRSWLVEHLRQRRLHPRREEHCRIALLGFHKAKYPADAGVQWQDGLTGTVLWAAFSGVPLMLQGSLREALAAYATGSEERAQCCRTYLDGMSEEEREGALLRVLHDEVVPMLSRRLSEREIRELFRRIDPRESPPQTRWESFRRRSAAGLRRQMKIELAAASSAYAFEVEGTRLVLTPWFRDFLQSLVLDGARPLLSRSREGRTGGAEL